MSECGTRAPIRSPQVGGGLYDLFRIVGGKESEFGVWPWQTSLLRVYSGGVERQRCGTVLIARNWVATAAHCVKGFDPSDFRLRFGDHDRYSESEPLPHVDREAYEIFVHEKYNQSSYEYDLALIYFDEPLKYR